MRVVLVLLAGLVLASCAGNTAPGYTGPDYQEPGFAAYCTAHPHAGVCP